MTHREALSFLEDVRPGILGLGWGWVNECGRQNLPFLGQGHMKCQLETQADVRACHAAGNKGRTGMTQHVRSQTYTRTHTHTTPQRRVKNRGDREGSCEEGFETLSDGHGN